MCGIVTALAFGKLNKKEEEIRQVLMRLLTTELLIETEDRGKDATGASVLFDDGRFFGIKRGESSGNFLSVFGEGADCFGNFLKIWREYDIRTRVYLGHCRQGTTGDKEDNTNNHPIKINNMVGIHNGVIKNHEVIFKNLGCPRDGKVDSEAIFRLFDYYTNGGKEPFTISMMQEVCNRLEGQYAITMFNADNPFQIPMMRDGRPIEFVLIHPFQMVLGLSDKKFWDKVHFQYERLVNYYSESLKIELPSLLDKGDVTTENLEDDSAIIFDLTSEMKPKSTIKDLGKWAKMERFHKIWAESTKTCYSGASNYNGGTAYNRVGTSSKGTPPKSSTSVEDNKKRRVWDSIKKRYVVKVGDKEIADNEEVVLDATNDYETDEKGTEKKEGTIMPVKKEETVLTDLPREVDEKKEAELKDTSSYEEDGGESDIIEIDPRDVTTLTANSSAMSSLLEEISDSSTVEVKTETIPPELFSEAVAAYDKLPLEKKGFNSLDEMVLELDIKDVSTATTLAPLMLANRAHKAGFRKGYLAKAMEESPLKRSGDKDTRRERHIVLLKSILIMMVKYYNATTNMLANREIFTNIAKGHVKDREITSADVESLKHLLNQYERETTRFVSVELEKAINEEEKQSNEGAANSFTV